MARFPSQAAHPTRPPRTRSAAITDSSAEESTRAAARQDVTSAHGLSDVRLHRALADPPLHSDARNALPRQVQSQHVLLARLQARGLRAARHALRARGGGKTVGAAGGGGGGGCGSRGCCSGCGGGGRGGGEGRRGRADGRKGREHLSNREGKGGGRGDAVSDRKTFYDACYPPPAALQQRSGAASRASQVTSLVGVVGALEPLHPVGTGQSDCG